jgi:hypothetical protein
MTDLVINLKALLEHPDDHTRNEADSLFNGQRLSPSNASSSLIQEALMQHLVQDFVVNLGTIMVKDFCGPDTPSPNLIVWRTFRKDVLIPSKTGVGISPHLDLSFQHTIDNLSMVRTKCKDPINPQDSLDGLSDKYPDH